MRINLRAKKDDLKYSQRVKTVCVPLDPIMTTSSGSGDILMEEACDRHLYQVSYPLSVPSGQKK